MFKEFKTFITRGNVVDLAVGIIIGVAFGAIISSFVNDVLMPPIGLGLGNIDFANLFVVLKEGTTAAPYASLTAAKDAGAVTINYGVFVSTIVNFLIIAASVFFIVVRPLNRYHARHDAAKPVAAPATRDCPFCATAIPVKATRCPNCTSQLSA
jgi:large conductance mechanosensitive channel